MNKNYWESLYLRQNADLKPSLFAKYIADNFFKEGKSLIELGCGNGRDAIFFANEGIDVLAIDQCENEIEFLKNRFSNPKNVRFLCGDFTNLDNNESFDIIYSRFTLHSITEKEERKTLIWSFTNLNPNGILCVEVRGHGNEIFGKGEPVIGEKNAYIYDEHYRRFLNFNNFCKNLSDIGFFIDYAEEAKGFAPYKGEDQTFIRVIARKK
ncbi:class I SAM-dependent methyltransferase [bacterium]|nr:class I SAM-dependent methyltransferase [bacterium]MBU1066156.1 class I SAM-dependent methyltransferase [bacterium]MBU1874759.1 class I SAM-dependent methyltransferase [bacterium]